MKQLYAIRALLHFNVLRSVVLSLMMTIAGIFSSEQMQATCNNITWGGNICCDQSGCPGFDPSTIWNQNSPTGGSGTIQYMWLYKSASTGWNYQTISGASSSSYDPGPLNETTKFRRCSRRQYCSSWDGESNEVTITITSCNTCNNVTNGGTIGSNQSGCPGFDPAALTNVTSPSGGSGALEIMWLYKNASTGGNYTTIAGASSLGYDPGPLTETTTFRRCTRRAGCTNWDGESNEITITITDCCNGNINSVSIFNLSNNTSTAITNGAVFYVNTLPSSWNVNAIVSGTTAESVRFTWSGSYSANHVQNSAPYSSPDDVVPLNLGAGNYTLNVKLYPQDNAGGLLCDEETYSFTIIQCDNFTSGGTIGSNQSGCAPYNPAAFTSLTLPTGGSGTIEYLWIYRNASTNNQWVEIANSNSATYDAGDLTQTTDFRRCARRGGCTEWNGESNIITVTITGNCTPQEICTLDGYESIGGRIFWLPSFGTDFKSSPSNPLKFEKYSNGTARMVGTIERISNSNHKFNVSLWFEGKSNFMQWVAQGLSPHSPELGDETTWTFYKFSTTLPNTLTGQGSLAGTTLYLTNQNPIYGLQLGAGANALNTNANGISSWFNYTGTSGAGAISGYGDLNGTYNCPPACALTVNAGPDQFICAPVTSTLTATITGAGTCSTPGTSDCNHVIAGSGGWLENVPASGVCGDNAGTKLWTQSGQGTSFVTLDLGVTVPAGTQICVRMKLEHCSNSGSNNSNAKIQSSLNSSNSFTSLTNSVTFSQTSYQEFCYTLSSSARYIKVSDYGSCAFRVDYVKYTTTGAGSNAVTYAWAGPGIVGSNNGPSIQINQHGTYTVTVTDCNGCVATDSVNITTDSIPPVISNVPQNITVECDNIPAPITPSVTDNLDTSVVLVYTQTIVPGDQCTYYIHRTWTATDDCNNTSSATQIITVTDTTNPTLNGVPANATVECSDVPAPPVVTASDNCDQSMTVVYNQTHVAIDNCTYQLIRTWTVSDDCNNTASASQTITVTDTTNPTLSNVPEDITVQCDDIPGPPLVIGNDNCDDQVQIIFDEVTSDGCPYTITRTWTGIDNCQNMVTASQVITVIDTTFPVLFGVPADETIECDETPSTPVVTATDNCIEDLMVSMSAVTEPQECGYLFIRTWSVTDACGNTTTASQTITVFDTTDPEIENAPENINVECSDDIPAYSPIWTDNCDQELTLSAASSIAVDDCYEIITQTYTATDDCGNTSTVTRVINIVDTTDPILVGVPANATVECSDIPAAAIVTATDNCDEDVDVDYNQSIVEVDNCTYYIHRTWTATDECGNIATATQVLTVTDTIDPILVGVPANATVECSDIPAPAVVTATDNCDNNVEVELTSEVITGSGCTYLIIRTWTATDNCGNTSTASQTLQVVDTTDPVLNGVPTNITVECDAIPIVANVTVSDNCDEEIEVIFTETISEGCPYTITRTWYAADHCENDVTATQIITVIDTTYPVLIGVPADETIECDEMPSTPVVTATDNCTDELVVSMSAVTEPQECGYLFIRTWSVTDACGNTTTASQTITVLDTTDPEIENAPENINVECSDDIPAYSPIWTDNCDEELTLSAASSIAIDDCYEIITQTYTATDDCGNTSTVTRVINIVDTTDPILVGVPANATVECSDIPAAAIVTATDNCDEDVDVDYNQSIVEGDDCTYYIHRTWTATDECGNFATATQVLTVTDTINPILVGVPANATVECSDIPAPAVVTATDNCDEDLQVGYAEQFVPGDACTYTLIRYWTVYDDCGNMASASQTLIVTDTTNPTLNNVPDNITVECDAIPAPAVVTGSDNCDDQVQVTMVEVISDGCPYTVTRTWTGVDNCGNTVVDFQVINVIDTTFPVLFGVPADETIECDEMPSTPVVTATDNCTEDLMVSMSAVTEPQECGYLFIRTWSVTDACGNTTTASQTITVVDTTDPEIENAPENINVECSDDIPAYTPIWSDNCDEELTLSAASSIAIDDCYEIITQTYTATDDCGNTSTVTRVINIVDTTDPILVGVPANATVECSDIPAAAIVTATDNCDEDVDVDYNQSIVEGDDCTYYIHRTWTATDECGNFATATQVLTVTDTINPILVGVPANATVECSDIPAPAVVTATDNCDLDVTIDYNQELVTGSGCTYLIIRTWTATDDCGNEASAQQILEVTDTTAPVISGNDIDVTLECSESPEIITPTVADNCDEEVVVEFEHTTIQGECPNSWTEVYTWTATDRCYNVSTRVFTYHFVDTTSPVLVGVPQNATYECDNVPGAPLVTAEDNCDEDVEVQYNEQINLQECGYTILRTWTAADDCGNPVIATQLVTVQDTTDPVVLFAPADATYECDEEYETTEPIFSDNCDENLIILPISSIIQLECGYLISKSWTAIDNCGNETTVSQSITIVDTTSPELIGVPADQTVECDNIPAAAIVTVSDNCDTEVEVEFSEMISEGCPYTITRTWSSVDNCNNEVTATQIITVIDTTFPVVEIPADLTVECDNIPAVGESSASDNCDTELELGFSETIIENDGCSYVIVRTWTAKDNCDNLTSESQYITVVDTTYPTLIGVPADATVECDNVPAAAIVTADDNCAENLIPSFEENMIEQECGYLLFRTWRVSDNCGNETVATQIITVVDTTEPTFSSIPEDATINCGDEIPAIPALTASDNCDPNVAIEYSESIENLECGYIIHRMWNISDNCGNSNSTSQNIYVLDEIAPVITGVPADITIECDQEIPAPADDAYATDNCDTEVTVEVNDTTIPLDCGYQIVRYYSATDACGNSTYVPQIITVVDTTDPMIEAPADITVNCNDIPAAAEVSATDNCDDDVEVSFSEEIEGGCPYNIIRTWTATDDCGNTTVVSQVISVIDEINPVFDAYLPFVEVECDAIGAYILTATDNCDNEVEVVVTEELQVSGQCYGSILRTYVATDNCGNTATAFQIIDIVDTTAPVLSEIPSDMTIECGEDLPAIATVTATDNCSSDLEVVYTQTQTNEFCPYDVIRTWTTIDECGNVTTGTQVIHVTVTVPNDIQLIAYPNPAQDNFTVKFSVANDEQVTGAIYDVTGRMVHSIINAQADGGRLYEWQINAANFRAGSYVIMMNVGDKVVHEKMMINGK